MNYIETHIQTEKESSAHFALKLQSDLWGIPKGALLVCQAQGEIEENKIMVLKAEKATILAKFQKVGAMYIMNVSTTAEPMPLTPQQYSEMLSEFVVLGKAINYSVEC